MQNTQLAKLRDYLTVGEAAAFLGVSPWTLRNWDRAGKLRPRRHPKNGYRIYRQEDLTEILQAECGRALGDVLAPPCASWKDMEDAEHFVQFYETDEFLTDSVAGYAGAALRAGDAAVVVATPERREAISAKLAAAGVDVAAHAAAGRFLSFDAVETLARFMVDGAPDPARFRSVIGSHLGGMFRNHKRIRAFGEMVAVLWDEGNRAGAIELEKLWNDLQREHPFSLFCAYPMRGFAEAADGEHLSDVCTCHSRVIPAESYAALSTADQRLRAIALMQQKIRSLEAELARCRGAATLPAVD